jgi:DNA-binding response OmpR family regulator
MQVNPMPSPLRGAHAQRGPDKMRVLVVEDENDIAGLVKHTLERGGDTVVEIASSGDQALKMASEQQLDLIILDLNLPVLGGLEVCRLLRTRPATAKTPIIMLTARTTESDRVVGLDAGADDYVTKPFSPRELLARVRRAMRRNGAKARLVSNVAAHEMNHEMLVFKDVHVDFTSMEATRAGKPVAMTAQEFKLLKFFAKSPERVISREELLNEVWGYQNYPSTRTVDNHILRLRQKLEPDPANPRFFLTMHGAGYKFVPGQASGGKNN